MFSKDDMFFVNMFYICEIILRFQEHVLVMKMFYIDGRPLVPHILFGL